MHSNLVAIRKWNKLDKATKQRLHENIFCGDCFVTTIVDYEITMDKAGIVLRGKCKQCGKDVARWVKMTDLILASIYANR